MPEDVAGTVIEAMDAERFLILPHPRVGASFLRKATDYDAWLSRTRDRLRGFRSMLSAALASIAASSLASSGVSPISR